MYILLNGIVMGLSIAAPVGPISLLCIRRTLAHGKLSGFLSGLGVATADMVYGFIAAFGLSFVLSFLLQYKLFISILGGVFLCFLGAKTMLAKPVTHAAAVTHTGLVADYFSIFGLTITNPMTVLSFIAVFAGIGIEAGNYIDASILVVGVFIGSALWWVLLVGVTSLVQKRINSRAMLWIDRLSGCIIFVFGIVTLGRLLL
jgi:threonine/homoserine/homoserine lactone efflux protein